ncbi:hypothetical protein Y032_0123g1177 [Ancylostoma ceylanicum]|uniref:Uncharacterized protein n=1 Tax=Ancylostoma ceylanicum TaxID=53326 RepID=A0A016T9N0_9BILA|nr:hypothetical protein Y032_0123g1177 [Ancylostoma ceylanicum]
MCESAGFSYKHFSSWDPYDYSSRSRITKIGTRAEMIEEDEFSSTSRGATGAEVVVAADAGSAAAGCLAAGSFEITLVLSGMSYWKN